MGKLFIEYLEGNNIYSCATCFAHLASYNDLISKAFRGRSGKAYLFNKSINITMGPFEDRMLLTGLHTICDLYCKNCNSVVGWKYVSLLSKTQEKAYEESQKYKEGKFILEKGLLKKEYWNSST